MNGLLKFLRTTIIGGLLFLVPVVLLIVILEKGFVIARRLIKPVVTHLPDVPMFGVPGDTIVAILCLVVLSIIAGIIARTSGAQRLVGWIETVILSRMPGYTMYRGMVGDMTQGMSSLERSSTAHAVLVRIEDAWQIGFVTDTLKNGDLAVFVPGAPSPLSGSLFFMPKDRVRESGLTVQDATAMLRRIGIGSGERLTR
ncbi:DUF502 domain-containing protein [Dokdonella sp.]|uniref:DUF502 domain-containing protein n=1 Tax=Dokdonella sp. TaxID=2291710 RepID=UPI003527D596